ncbi:hypothetical protein RR46_11858 [Papilio xuthus]|uniref:Uncharacterized protein n=1 Tax=Papilio xuthus TaxID=66420 RepID=A0A194PQ38_PAPXU|nr:hypothetical protein RR46_11858 [Papilio xuthus]
MPAEHEPLLSRNRLTSKLESLRRQMQMIRSTDTVPLRRKEVMEVSGESWRTYYAGGEPALAAAALGVAEDAHGHGQPQPLVAEYYKLPPLAQDAHLNLHKDVKIDVWP